MHAVLLTLAALTAGADYEIVQDGSSYYAENDGDCSCNDAGGGCGSFCKRTGRRLSRCSGPMPQTCYSPRYGCYPGNARYIQRYPAFHGAYYRRPYNYRNTFDYPWHASMHEPTSLFSYNVPPEEEIHDDGLAPVSTRVTPGIPSVLQQPGSR